MLEFYTGPYRNLIAKRIYCCKFNESTLGSVSTEPIGYVQRNVGAKRISINLVLHFPLPPPSLLKISTVLQGWGLYNHVSRSGRWSKYPNIWSNNFWDGQKIPVLLKKFSTVSIFVRNGVRLPCTRKNIRLLYSQPTAVCCLPHPAAATNWSDHRDNYPLSFIQPLFCQHVTLSL